jgi:tRNA-dihydrouridine synthase A
MLGNTDHRFCVAPMMEWTDRHCRAFHRTLTRRAMLYTEMVTAAAVIHGDRERLIGFDAAEGPVGLQLGGSDPDALARAAAIGEAFGYDEINLNCGCPSDRVQSGRFGACLMAEPELVARCFAAMRGAVSVPVTVKCRIAIDDQDESALDRFVAELAGAGCRTFIVHARKAWLQGLSPKQNRDVPPLNHARVHRLKADRPELEVIVNGGIGTSTRQVPILSGSTASCWAGQPITSPGCSPMSTAGSSAPPTRSKAASRRSPPGCPMSRPSLAAAFPSSP